MRNIDLGTRPSIYPPLLNYRPLLVLAAILCLLPGLAAAQGPQAAVVDPILDFGEMTRGDKKSGVFVIENKGDVTLEIIEVKPSCACTVVDFDDQVPAGATSEIRVELDTASLSEAIQKSILVYTSDVNNPVLTLTVKAAVANIVDAFPGYIRYIVVQGFEEDSTITQTIFAPGEQAFDVTNVVSPYSFIETSFREARPEERDPNMPGRQWLVSTRIANDAPIGALRDHLRVELDGVAQDSLDIPLSGFVRPLFAITPEVADFGERELDAEEPHWGSVKVQNFAAENISLSEATVDIEGVSTEIKEDVPGHIFFVRLQFDENPKTKGPFSGTLRIKTDSPKQSEILIPVKGTFR